MADTIAAKQRNEAAERLLTPLDWEPTAQEVVSYRLNANDPAMRDYNWQEWRSYTTRRLLDEALAAERRATVQRIRVKLDAYTVGGFRAVPKEAVERFLDEELAQEEAARSQGSEA